MRRRFSLLTIGFALIVVGITAWLAIRGWSFYTADDRPSHPDFRTLRSYGRLGNGYGWVAALLVVLNLSYLVRRRLGGPGPLRVWLDVHVFTGLLAASLVSFHSAFELRTPAAIVGTASLALVVATGLVGRWLHARSSPLMRSWRRVHVVSAVVMIAAVLVHAGIAWQAGYRWIFA